MALSERPPVGAVVRRNHPGGDHRLLGVFHGKMYTVESWTESSEYNFYLVGVNKPGPRRPTWGLEFFDLVSQPEEPIIEAWWEK